MGSSVKMPASQFKAECLRLMDEVQQSGKAIVITKHERPVAQLGPVREPAAGGHFGAMRGMIRIVGDLDASLADPEAEARWLATWDAKLGRPR
jgi:antitoxin (DNA-binding transcriptional repressor) of toxin-antitoxin stability system